MWVCSFCQMQRVEHGQFTEHWGQPALTKRKRAQGSTLLTFWVLIRNKIWMPLTLNWAPAGTWVSSAQQRMQPLCWHQLSSCCNRHDSLMAYQHTQTPSSTMAARLSKVEEEKRQSAEGHVKWNVTELFLSSFSKVTSQRCFFLFDKQHSSFSVIGFQCEH
jgi:hypothetical protein